MFNDDPANMSIDDRLDELAALLAAGFLRLKRRTGCLPLMCGQSSDWSHVKGLPPDAIACKPLPHSRGSDCISESAESSRILPDSPCHLSENLALCDCR
jgi:hypothetical protein